MSLKTLILAGGKGTRMKSSIPKVLHRICGTPILKKVMDVCEKIGSEENIVVLGHNYNAILETIGDINYVLQEEQLGTGHAVMQSEEKLKEFEGTLMVLCGDTPLIREETLKNLYKVHKESKATTTILTSVYENPFGYGRIVKDGSRVLGIVEEKDATEAIKCIKEVNAGAYCFEVKELVKALKKIDNKNKNNEYYLTDVIAINVKENKLVKTYLLKDNNEILGVNSRIDLEKATHIMRKRINRKHMNSGVTFIDASSTYIDDGVEIGEDSIIYPGVILEGKTKIGKYCKILGNTRVINSKIGDSVVIESSLIEDSIVDEKVTIGPFAHLRPKTHLKAEVHIGNFVEIKKSTIEKGTKVGHLTYLGDAIVGEKTNIGAGTITCNYDGKNKFQTFIGKNVFVGSDSMLIAPLKIGDNSLIGAGSVINKDVPENALAVSRSNQIIKLNWRK